MKKLIIKLIVVLILVLALFLSAVGANRVQALTACNPLIHFPCTGGGIVCIDKHGHIRHFHGRIHDGWRCIAI